MLVPDIESGVPIETTLPDMTEEEELVVRANTAKLISDLIGQPLVADPLQRQQAIDLFISNSHGRLPLSAYPNETLAYLAGMVTLYDGMVVKELANLKLYVANRLIEESIKAPKPETRISALKALGEIDGVDAFKKRSEITVQQRSNEEIEREILERIDRLTVDMGEVEEVEDADPSED
jgi:HEAT repeat protein